MQQHKEQIKQLLLAAAKAGRGTLERKRVGMWCELDQEDVDAIYWACKPSLDLAELYERALISLSSKAMVLTQVAAKPMLLSGVVDREIKELAVDDAFELFTNAELSEIWKTHAGYGYFTFMESVGDDAAADDEFTY